MLSFFSLNFSDLTETFSKGFLRKNISVITIFPLLINSSIEVLSNNTQTSTFFNSFLNIACEIVRANFSEKELFPDFNYTTSNLDSIFLLAKYFNNQVMVWLNCSFSKYYFFLYT